MIKYTGSKRKLIPEIEKYMPPTTTLIMEPFAGSAAFSLSQDCTFMASDKSPELVNFMNMVRENPIVLAEEIGNTFRWFKKTSESTMHLDAKELYTGYRNKDRLENFLTEWDAMDRAVRYYFIIYHGFNGLYRVNKKNQCNTPFGKRFPEFSPAKFLEDAANLRKKCLSFHHEEFDDKASLYKLIEHKELGGTPFVLIDPPYLGVWNQYTPEVDGGDFYDRLLKYLDRLDAEGIDFLMTNSDKPELIQMVDTKFRVELVPIKYSIAADGTKRGTSFESFTSSMNRRVKC